MPRPFNAAQMSFALALDTELKDHGLEPRTLGVTDWDPDAPLTAVRRLMLESNGLVSVAFRRTLIEKGVTRAHSSGEHIGERTPLQGRALTAA